MTKITVYGSGCKKCKKLYENCVKAIDGNEHQFQVEYIDDIDKIISAGYLTTPILEIDGEKKLAGQSASVATIKGLLDL